MIVKYIGHACFKVTDQETGYSAVFDPYEPGSVSGFGDVEETASEVFCSHDHFDHNSADSVKVEAAGTGDAPFEITVIDTFHDDVKGAKRGPNRIVILKDKKTGERLVHYGDIGEVLDDLLADDKADLLKGADVILLPVGGVYTYDAGEALDLIKATSPGVAIPMHYRSEAGGYGLGNIGSIEGFLKMAEERGFKVAQAGACEFDTDAGDHSGCILAMTPQNI